jgi:hypothetical protein
MRIAAAREAHKLVGVVGTFGFARASEPARQFETAVETEDSFGSGRHVELELIVSERRTDPSPDPTSTSPARTTDNTTPQPLPADRNSRRRPAVSIR